MNERTDGRYSGVVPVQIYAKTRLTLPQLSLAAALDPYNLEEDVVKLRGMGVVFFRNGENGDGSVVDTAYVGPSFYTQVYVQEGAVIQWFLTNEARSIVQIKRGSVTFRYP